MKCRQIYSAPPRLTEQPVLVYAFEPFGPYATNISEETVRALEPHSSVVRKVFPVKFDGAMMRRVLQQVQPRYVLGLGLHPRARKIRIERRARNRMRLPANGGERKICGGRGPESMHATLPCPRTQASTYAYNAGAYVCNFSMWQMGAWCAKHGAQWAFLHLPKDAPLEQTVSYLQRCLRSILRNDADHDRGRR